MAGFDTWQRGHTAAEDLKRRGLIDPDAEWALETPRVVTDTAYDLLKFAESLEEGIDANKTPKLQVAFTSVTKHLIDAALLLFEAHR